MNAKASEQKLVDGVGAASLYSKDPVALAKWYSEKLDIKIEGQGEHYYAIFQRDEKDDRGSALSINKTKEDSPKNHVLNLRLNNFEATIKRLKEQGVITKEKDYGYAWFSFFKDIDGNQVEVWQPKSSL